MSEMTVTEALGISDRDREAVFKILFDASIVGEGGVALDTCKMVDLIDEAFEKPEEKVFAAYFIGRFITEAKAAPGGKDAGKPD